MFFRKPLQFSPFKKLACDVRWPWDEGDMAYLTKARHVSPVGMAHIRDLWRELGVCASVVRLREPKGQLPTFQDAVLHEDVEGRDIRFKVKDANLC